MSKYDYWTYYDKPVPYRAVSQTSLEIAKEDIVILNEQLAELESEYLVLDGVRLAQIESSPDGGLGDINVLLDAKKTEIDIKTNDATNKKDEISKLEEGLLFYPVTMMDYGIWSSLSDILVIDIYSMADLEILSMSYLEYLMKFSDEENKYIEKLAYLLSLVLKRKNTDGMGYGNNAQGKPVFQIDGQLYDGQDFEEIRYILAEQNSLKIPNHRIEKAIRDSLEEYRQIKQKINGNKQASLEDYMVALSVSSGIDLEKIYNMTIRKFWMSIERIDHKLHYEIYLSASVSGLVKFKNSDAVKHWLSSLEKDEFSGLMDYGELEGKAGG